jgi:hypothetical protein
MSRSNLKGQTVAGSVLQPATAVHNLPSALRQASIAFGMIYMDWPLNGAYQVIIL